MASASDRIPMAIRRADAACDGAAAALRAAVEAQYPVGSHVEVTLGRARIVGTVTGYGASWIRYVGEVWIRNSKTGRERSFNATYEGHDARRIAEAHHASHGKNGTAK